MSTEFCLHIRLVVFKPTPVDSTQKMSRITDFLLGDLLVNLGVCGVYKGACVLKAKQENIFSVSQVGRVVSKRKSVSKHIFCSDLRNLKKSIFDQNLLLRCLLGIAVILRCLLGIAATINGPRRDHERL